MSTPIGLKPVQNYEIDTDCIQPGDVYLLEIDTTLGSFSISRVISSGISQNAALSLSLSNTTAVQLYAFLI